MKFRYLHSNWEREDISVGTAKVPAGWINTNDDSWSQSRTYEMWSWGAPGPDGPVCVKSHQQDCHDDAGCRCLRKAPSQRLLTSRTCTENKVLWPVCLAVKQVVWAIKDDLFSPAWTSATRWKSINPLLLHVTVLPFSSTRTLSLLSAFPQRAMLSYWICSGSTTFHRVVQATSCK